MSPNPWDEVAKERKRQDEKWGQQDHDDLYWLGILTEEVGEVAREVIENGSAPRTDNELIQVAAVAIAWMECRNRRQERQEQDE